MPISEYGNLGQQGTIKLLAQGQLPVAAGGLYTGPSGQSAIVKLITYTNTNKVDGELVNLYVQHPGSNPRRVIPTDMFLDIGASMYYKDETTLASGDMVLGDAGHASIVDYVING